MVSYALGAEAGVGVAPCDPYVNENGLKPKDAALLDAYLATGSLPDAADLVGIHRTTAWRRANVPAFQEELARRSEELRRRVDGALLARQEAALAAIDAVLASPDERIRFRAATWVLERVLAGPAERAESGISIADLELEAIEREQLARLRALGSEAT